MDKIIDHIPVLLEEIVDNWMDDNVHELLHQKLSKSDTSMDGNEKKFN